MTLAGLAHLRAMVGDFERARDDYRRGRAILEELGLRFDASTISIDSGLVELLAGDPVAAEAELRKDYEALDAMGERNYIIDRWAPRRGVVPPGSLRGGRSLCGFQRGDRSPVRCLLAVPVAGIRGKLLARDGAHDGDACTSRRPGSPKHGRPTTSKGRAMR